MYALSSEALEQEPPVRRARDIYLSGSGLLNMTFSCYIHLLAKLVASFLFYFAVVCLVVVVSGRVSL